MEFRNIFVYISIMVLVFIICKTEACPKQCMCYKHQVDCYGRNLVEIPSNIPNASVYVDLQENMIPAILPDRISRLPLLEYLLLRRNKITRLESATFVNLTVLKRLSLNGNQIEAIAPDAFVNLPSLEVLDLSSNALTNVSGMFVNVPNVERLVLSLNQITEITDRTFEGLDKLQYLILSQNSIVSISNLAFSKLGMLSYFVLRGNPIKMTDKLWTGLDVLSFLDLTECQLSAVPNGLPWTLSILRLGKNSIKTITSTDFRSLKYLSVLYLENNFISSIQFGAFNHSSHLHQVVLSGNRLSQLPDRIPESVESFNADSNRIVHIFQNNFGTDSKMKELSLKNNSISDLAANTFSHLQSLKSLALDSNSIRVMHDLAFSGLSSLIKLSIGANPVREIQSQALGGLSKMSHLALSELKNEAIDVKGNFFEDTTSLTTLDLHESPSLVHAILARPEMLSSLSSVKYLNLVGNNLTHLSEDVDRKMLTLRMVRASDNPYHCDADLIPLRNLMMSGYPRFGDLSKMVCASPPGLKGRPIVDVPLSDFTKITTLSTTAAATTTTTTTTTYTTTTEKVTTTSSASSSSTVKPTTVSHTTSGTATTLFYSSSPSSPSSSLSTKISTLQTIPTSSLKPKYSTENTSTRTQTTRRQSESLTTLPVYTTGKSSLRPSTSSTNPVPSYSPTQAPTTSKQSTGASRQSRKTTTTRQTTATSKRRTTNYQSTTSQPTQESRGTRKPTKYTTGILKTTLRPSSRQTTNWHTTQSGKTSTGVYPGTTNKFTRTSSPHVPQTSAVTKGSTRTVNLLTTGSGRYTKSKDQSKTPQEGASHLDRHSSADSKKQGIIIGVSVSLVCLVLLVAIIVFMVRYQRRKKAALFLSQDVSFATHQEELPDTVRIIDHLHHHDHDDPNLNPTVHTTQSDSTWFQKSVQNGNTDTDLGKNTPVSKPGEPTLKEQGKSETTNRNNWVNLDDDDTDMLMDSWS